MQQQQEAGDDAEDAQTEDMQQLKRGQDISWPYPISLLSRSSPACQEKHRKSTGRTLPWSALLAASTTAST